MFDYVRVKLATFERLSDLQTKAFDCELATYELRPDGIVKTGNGYGEDPLLSPVPYVLSVHFHGDDETGTFRRYEAKYQIGELLEIKLLNEGEKDE